MPKSRVMRVKRMFQAKGTEWTKALGRTGLGDRLDALVPVTWGWGAFLSPCGLSCGPMWVSSHYGILRASRHWRGSLGLQGQSPEDQAKHRLSLRATQQCLCCHQKPNLESGGRGELDPTFLKSSCHKTP